MAAVELQASHRQGTGSQAAKQLRRRELIPAIVYRAGEPSVPLVVGQRSLAQVLRTSAGENVLITLRLEGETATVGVAARGRKSGKASADRTVMIREIQKHPVTGAMLHVDFHEILLTERIRVKVPIVAKGEPIGVKQDGGVLDHLLWELEIECLPTQIPEQLEVEVTSLKIGDSIPVKAVSLPEGVTTLADPNAPVIAVAAPHVEKVEEPTEAAAAEPEVLKQKKPEEEAGAAAPEKAEKAEKKAEK